MANITKKAADAPAWFGDWDPFQLMRQWMGERAGPSLFTEEERRFTPTFDVLENENGYVFHADLPGVKEEDIKVNIEGNRLTISGKREQEKRRDNDTYYRVERSYGSFMRTFTLPDTANAASAKAELADGVLTLTMPKKTEIQPKKISVTRKK